MLGKIVIVRDHMAGVFVGRLVSLDLAAKAATLSDARKVHYWTGAGAVEGLAAHGCSVAGSRITAMVATVAVCAVVQVCECTEESVTVLMGAPEWRP